MYDPKRYDEFVNLVRLHTNRMLGYLDALLLNRDDAEDLFQETCLVLWRKFDEFRAGTVDALVAAGGESPILAVLDQRHPATSPTASTVAASNTANARAISLRTALSGTSGVSDSK